MKQVAYILCLLVSGIVVSCGHEVGRKGSLPFEGPAVPTPTPEPTSEPDPSAIPTGVSILYPPANAQVLQVFQVSWSAQPGADRYDVWFSANEDCKNPVAFAGNITNVTAQFIVGAAGEYSLCQIAFEGDDRAWKPTNNGVRFTVSP